MIIVFVFVTILAEPKHLTTEQYLNIFQSFTDHLLITITKCQMFIKYESYIIMAENFFSIRPL